MLFKKVEGTVGGTKSGEALLNQKVEVTFLPTNSKCSGTVTSFDAVRNEHRVVYENGDTEFLNFSSPSLKMRLVEVLKPTKDSATNTPQLLTKCGYCEKEYGLEIEAFKIAEHVQYRCPKKKPSKATKGFEMDPRMARCVKIVAGEEGDLLGASRAFLEAMELSQKPPSAEFLAQILRLLLSSKTYSRVAYVANVLQSVFVRFPSGNFYLLHWAMLQEVLSCLEAQELSSFEVYRSSKVLRCVVCWLKESQQAVEFLLKHTASEINATRIILQKLTRIFLRGFVNVSSNSEASQDLQYLATEMLTIMMHFLEIKMGRAQKDWIIRENCYLILQEDAMILKAFKKLVKLN